MNVTINGQAKTLNGVSNVAAMVAQTGVNAKHLIAEINGAIIPGDQWASTPIKDGDTIELVAFVGGG